jgi:hypothetical protein
MPVNKRYFTCLAIALGALTASAHAVPTPITVRVIAKNAKLVGDPAGGASIIIRDTETGVVLASGKTTGGSGDTKKLVGVPLVGGAPFAQPGDAAFSATIDLAAPRRITVEAGSPGLGAYGGSSVSQTQWVLPGKSPHGPDGWLVELPGFMVDFLKPARHATSPTRPITVPIEANVVLMCGCPVEAGGLWNSNKYQIDYVVTRNGQAVTHGPLRYAGVADRFAGQFIADSSGVYDIVVTAFDPATGNAGVAETTFEVD